MHEKLQQAPKKVVGAKQVRRALEAQRATMLFVAEDADLRLVQPLVRLALEKKVPIYQIPTMKQLGDACAIAVKSAVAAVLS